jgi:hypothetical protein
LAAATSAAGARCSTGTSSCSSTSIPNNSACTRTRSGYAIWFDHVYGAAAVRRAVELAQKYGFEVRFVFEGLGGFYAILSNEQLAALSREPDLTTYTGDGGGGGSFYISGPIHLNCLQASRQDRKELAQAFAARIHI